MWLLEGTDQIESIGTWLVLQIVHDVSVLIPGKHQAKVGDGRRDPVEREDVVVLELFHQHHFLAKPLQHLSGQRRGNPWGSHSTLTLLFLCMRGSSRATLRTLSATTSSLYIPLQISATWEIRCAQSPSFTTSSSVYEVGTVR